MASANIRYLTDIHFDVSVGGVLPGALEDLGVMRPLVVTDPDLSVLGLVGRLGVRAAAVYDRVLTNPDEAGAAAALDIYRAHDCDGCVAVGGGSSIDLAKAVSLLVNHEPPLERYAFIRGGLERIDGKRLVPVVAVPTTAGSGAEVGRAALITMASGDKLAILSPRLIPAAAICDVELTRSMPPKLTAATGMDAISHCVENFCSPDDNPIADAIALDGLERGWKNIRRAVEKGEDRAARREMMVAALAGGLTFQKGLGAVHSLSHALGGLKRVRLHHGTLNGVFLPHVVRFNIDSCSNKMQAMTARMGLARHSDLPEAVAKLVADIGLPARLAEMGVVEEDLKGMPGRAHADHCTLSNPRKLSVEDCASLYRAAM
jgi:4-hydroxybutyrate dehydrogenase